MEPGPNIGSVVLSGAPVEASPVQFDAARVLLVEDSATSVSIVRRLLDTVKPPYDVKELRTVDTLAAGIDLARAWQPDVALLDLTLPDSHGLDTYRRFQDAVDVPVIVLTGSDDRIGFEAARHGAQDFIRKADLSGSLLARSIHYARERARLLRKLSRLAWFDELTGLRNRRGFFEAADDVLVAARRGDAEATAVYVDLNDLKRINDSSGHGAGDAAIIAVARAIETAVAAVGEQDIDIAAGRLGGDEFCTLMAGSAEPFLQALVTAIDAVNDERAAPVRVSAGRATARAAEVTLDELLMRADADLYAAKAKKPAT